MSNADKKRAENLASMFAAPAPKPTAREDEPTAVASAVGVLGKVVSIAPVEDEHKRLLAYC